MTPYYIIILGYCRVHLKKWHTYHWVLMCWPHSTIFRSQGLWSGLPGLLAISQTTDWITGMCLWRPITGAGAISASGNGRDVIQDGGWKRKWPCPFYGVLSLYTALDVLRIALFQVQHRHMGGTMFYLVSHPDWASIHYVVRGLTSLNLLKCRRREIACYNDPIWNLKPEYHCFETSLNLEVTSLTE